MKYSSKEFTENLQIEIEERINLLKQAVNSITEEYQEEYRNNERELDMHLASTSEEIFQQGADISIVIDLSKRDLKSNILVIPIWLCGRRFFGFPVSKNIPGSKLVGELSDESVEDMVIKIKKYLEESKK